MTTKKERCQFKRMLSSHVDAALRRILAGRKQNVLASRPLCYAPDVMMTCPFANDEPGVVPGVSGATSRDCPALKPQSRRIWRGFLHAAVASFALAFGPAASTEAAAASG